MESSSSTTRFKFRDHQDMDASALSDASSVISSLSSDPLDIGDDDDDYDGADDSDLQSMTATGIKHLCSELLELKAASDEEFQENIFANYSAFVRIFEEVEGIENELMKLKNHVSNQKKFVKELVDGIYVKLIVEEAEESVIEDSVSDELNSPSKLKAHINYVSETLDTLLSENRFDEALDIVEIEDENLERLQRRKGSSAGSLKLYNSVIVEGTSVLMLKLRVVAENPRTAAAELQQALSRICRLGNGHLATDLLLKYYNFRIEAGIHSLRSLKSFPWGVYIRELSKFVFSMISQAARSFVMLHGETSPYTSELIQWAQKETEAFTSSFGAYIRSISELSGGLCTVAIAQDVSPLAAHEMESSTIKCLTDLFMEYISSTEKVINGDTGHLDRGKDDRTVSSMETLMNHISILFNLLTLECLFSRIIRSILNCKSQRDSSNMDEHDVLDNSFLSIQEALGRVRSCFCQQYISRIMSNQNRRRISSKASSGDPSDSVVSHDAGPSIPLQVFFLELRKIRELAEEVVEVSWMRELLKDVIEAIFDWITGNQVISTPHEEKLTLQHFEPTQDQFILDVQFLVEIAKHGEYFSENPFALEKLRESSFLSVGLDPERDTNEDDWAIIAAGEAIEKLLQIEEEEVSRSEPGGAVEGEIEPFKHKSVQDDCLSSREDSTGSDECAGGRDASLVIRTADAFYVPDTEADAAGDLDHPSEEGIHGGEGSSRMPGRELFDTELTGEAAVKDQGENEVLLD
ncbi:exocyst complex component EXO84B-like isoform X2 [Punica granatum]|uniref:Exocyst complex component EXO84B-like isoform X2 n=1 Tax=Punica granatum TaxID=22663 RepID=A0A6P8C8V0_PUNGR|nr:exocyst complex component EXO84B-like isoform X2 [Punica granatum]